MQQEYTAVIKKSGKWYVAWIKEVPGALTQGRTLKEVRENLHEALALMLEENERIASLKKPTKINPVSLHIAMPERVSA